MSDGIVIALIGLVGTGYAATIPLMVSTRRHAKQASWQTTNRHQTNLRDDVTALDRRLERIEQYLGMKKGSSS